MLDGWIDWICDIVRSTIDSVVGSMVCVVLVWCSVLGWCIIWCSHRHEDSIRVPT